MAKIVQPQLNEYAIFIEDGDWQLAITKMVNRGHSREEIAHFCWQINFYPDNEFWSYFDQLKTKASAAVNKQTLDNFFSKF